MLILPDVSGDESDLAIKNTFPVLYWNHAALEMNRVTHSLGGPQTGPTMSSRAIGLLHLAMHDAFFATLLSSSGAATHQPYLRSLRTDGAQVPDPTGTVAVALTGIANTLEGANKALTGAAVLMLDRLYRSRGPGISAVAHQTLADALSKLIAEYGPLVDTLSPEHRFGELVANLIFAQLAVKPGEIGADQGRFEPRQDRYAFRDEPSNPVRRVPIDPDLPERGDTPVRIYHAPFYGETVASFAVSDDDLHRLAEPYVWYGKVPSSQDLSRYQASVHEVRRRGGAPDQGSTHRLPDETAAAIFWAYDGANLIGTSPRLYNQIVRVIAWERLVSKDPKDQASNEQLVRLFAICNAAMADAGKFAWREKYRFQLWRPLSGVREHDLASGPAAPPNSGSSHLADEADPFWLALGAPETNTDRITFKPPFPAYPSGHATFGAACFQMLRLFYANANGTQACTMPIPQQVDELDFSFVSDELNGQSRDLRQPYKGDQPIADQPGLVRTRIVRKFDSLSHAIFENAFSRIWLGVHWNFDAFDPVDVQTEENGETRKLPEYKSAASIIYTNVYAAGRDPAKPTDYPIGGVPLGLGIANDIFCTGLIEPPPQKVPADNAAAAPALLPATAAALRGEQVAIKASNTSTAQAAQ